MNRIIEYSDDYKEELFKYGNSGVVLIKDKGFALSSEFKIFTQGNKKKSDHFMFLDINDNKTLNGIIAVNKEGIISYLSTTDKEFKNLPDLINKCDGNNVNLTNAKVNIHDLDKIVENAFTTMGGLFKVDPTKLTKLDVLEILKESM